MQVSTYMTLEFVTLTFYILSFNGELQAPETWAPGDLRKSTKYQKNKRQFQKMVYWIKHS
jgi:hypothetical protein